MTDSGRCLGYVATLEWLCDCSAVLRLHPGADSRLGDPYIWSCFVHKVGDEAIFKGALAAPPLSALPAILVALQANGFSRRRHERIKGGPARVVHKPLPIAPVPVSASPIPVSPNDFASKIGSRPARTLGQERERGEVARRPALDLRGHRIHSGMADGKLPGESVVPRPHHLSPESLPAAPERAGIVEVRSVCRNRSAPQTWSDPVLV